MAELLTKRKVALQHLEDAAVCYYADRYASALTLAGAAEEVLGRIAKRKEGFNQLDVDVAYLSSIADYFDDPRPSNDTIKKVINSAKNELKHNDSGEDSEIALNLENECVLFFVKAVKNYFEAFGVMPESEKVVGLFEWLTL